MDEDRDQLPGCAACHFIGRICPRDCALAPHFDTGRTFAGLRLDCLGRTVIECARCYHLQELRRIFIEGAVEFFAQASPGEEVHRLLVEAILSEAEKALEPPPEPALHSFSSAYPQFSSPGEIRPLTKDLARIAWMVEASLDEDDGYQDFEDGSSLSDLDGTTRYDNDGDGGYDDVAHEVEHDTEDLMELDDSANVESAPALTRILEPTPIKIQYCHRTKIEDTQSMTI